MRKYCHDCGVKIGEYHEYGCDAPLCTLCGIQTVDERKELVARVMSGEVRS